MNQTLSRVEILYSHYKQKEKQMLNLHWSKSRARAKLIFEMQELNKKIKQEASSSNTND